MCVTANRCSLRRTFPCDDAIAVNVYIAKDFASFFVTAEAPVSADTACACGHHKRHNLLEGHAHAMLDV